MKAFVDTPITKEQFLKHLRWHQEQDAFVKGEYSKKDSDQFKGCAVGCSIHSIQMELKEGQKYSYDEHEAYEEFLNVPEWLARLEDTIFEGLPKERSKTWPIEFVEAINVGAELDKIRTPFLIFILEQNLNYLESLDVDESEHKQVYESIELSKAAVQQVINAHKSNGDLSAASASSAASAARSTAWSAAWSTACSAAWSAAMSAESVACSAAWSAESAAWSAASASSAAYEKYADHLLELMRECN